MKSNKILRLFGYRSDFSDVCSSSNPLFCSVAVLVTAALILVDAVAIGEDLRFRGTRFFSSTFTSSSAGVAEIFDST